MLPVRGFGPGTQDFHVAELQLRWAVFQFGRQVAKHDQSVLRGEIARLQADRARQSVEFDVSQAYFRALEARSSLVIAEQGLTRAEAVLGDARNQERRGVLTAEDVLQAEVQVAEVRQLLTRPQRGAGDRRRPEPRDRPGRQRPDRGRRAEGRALGDR